MKNAAVQLKPGVVWLIFLALLIFSLAIVGGSARADTPIDTSTIKSRLVTIEPYDSEESYGPVRKTPTCETKTFYTRRLLGANSLAHRDSFSGCATEITTGVWIVSHGYGLYVKKTGTPIAGKIDYIDRYFKSAPGKDIIFEKDYVGGQPVVKVTDDFSQQLIPEFNYMTGTLTYRFDRSNSYLPRDNRGMYLGWNGSDPHFKLTEVSGSYMVLDFSDKPLVRIDRVSHDTLMYGLGSHFQYGGSRNKATVSLTTDGKYSARTRGGEAFLYDLSACSSPDNPTTERYRAYNSSDCDYLNLSAFIQQKFGLHSPASVINLDFDNSKQLRVWFFDRQDGSMREIQILLEGDSFSDSDNSYIALGDSFASGEGDMDDFWYELGTNAPENKCHLSRRSYPYLLAEQLGMEEFHSVACSGARTEHLLRERQKKIKPFQVPINNLGEWYAGVKPQKEYIIDSSKAPTTITLSIGGNDVGFADKLKECVLGPGTCKYAENSVFRGYTAMEVTSMYDRLLNTYKEIINTTEGNSRIFVVGYPQFVKGTGGSCGLNVHMNDSERYFINRATSYMNEIIKAASSEAGVHYLDIEDALEGNNLCSIVDGSKMAVNGLTEGDDTKIPGEIALLNPLFSQLTLFGVGAESYHPNQNGHRLMEKKILQLTDGDINTFSYCADGENICPSGERNVPIPDSDYWGDEATSFANLYAQNPDQKIPSHPESLAMITSRTFTDTLRLFSVNLRSLEPGSLVNFVLNSDPIDLGTYTVGVDGSLEAELNIPQGIPAGVHTLNATATNMLGEPVQYYQQVVAYDESSTDSACTFVDPSGVDSDNDSIDDACDGFYEETETTTANEVSVVTGSAQDDETPPAVTTISGSDSSKNDGADDSNTTFQAVTYLQPTGVHKVADRTPGTTLGVMENGQQKNSGVGNGEPTSNDNIAIILWVVAIVGMTSGVVVIARKS